MRDDQKTYIIAAVDSKNGIGIDGKLPWHLKKELAFFRDTTSEVWGEGTQNMVVMGRKTWESLPAEFRPLPNRHNVIITRNKHYEAEGAKTCFSLGEAMRDAEMDEKIENVFIIGGAQIFEMAIDVVDGMYLTKIEKDFECDAFFPELPERFASLPEDLGSEEEGGTKFSFKFYQSFDLEEL